MSSYAAPSDLFTLGAPQQAFQVGGVAIPDGTLQTELDAVSARADAAIAPRGQLPLLEPIPADLVAAVCKIAAYEILSARGLNPVGADSNLRLRYTDGIKWLDDVRTQRLSPLFVFSQDPAGTPHLQPLVVSSSVANLATGCRAPLRGW